MQYNSQCATRRPQTFTCHQPARSTTSILIFFIAGLLSVRRRRRPEPQAAWANNALFLPVTLRRTVDITCRSCGTCAIGVEAADATRTESQQETCAAGMQSSEMLAAREAVLRRELCKQFLGTCKRRFPHVHYSADLIRVIHKASNRCVDRLLTATEVRT